MIRLTKLYTLLISTHTLRKEGDQTAIDMLKDIDDISTHTLRKEGDDYTVHTTSRTRNFNPHPPQGG